MALPTDFITRTRALLGPAYEELEAALRADVPVSIRINREKGTCAPRQGDGVAWCPDGYYLPERLTFTFDPLFHAGAYYVQEASSMFLEQAIRTYLSSTEEGATRAVDCLDLCAAPGGKSTHLLSVLPEGSLVVSNEVIRSRSHILAENVTKWGNPNHIVVNNDPQEIGALTHVFDIIVADVPCSGEGMFRKDTDSTGEWSVSNVELCAARSRRIVHDIWHALRPGGLLVYSTCTYNTEENEENIQYFTEALGAEPLFIPVDAGWQISGPLKYANPVYRFFPHRTRGEGFFLAALRKPEGERDVVRMKAKNKKEKGKASPAVPTLVGDWLSEPECFRLEMREEMVQAIPHAHYETYLLIASRLRIVTAGIRLGEVKGKDILPAHALAMSRGLRREAFATVEIGWEEAIRYLKKEVLLLPEETPKGYVLVCYEGFPLGFVKHLGNRANNLYPQEWRIRSGYLPEEVKVYK